jgi:hypothetical protein
MKKLFKLSFVGVAICSAISFAQAKPNPQLTDYIMGSINGANSGQRINGQEQTNRGKQALKDSKLSNDEDSSCGAILCLAGGGNGGSSCSGYIRKYFRIKPHKRPAFLNICPKTDDPQAKMDSDDTGKNKIIIGQGSDNLEEKMKIANNLKVSCDVDEVYGLNTHKNYEQNVETFVHYSVRSIYDDANNLIRRVLERDMRQQDIYRQNTQLPNECNDLIDYEERPRPIYTCEANSEWFNADDWTSGAGEYKLIRVQGNEEFLANQNVLANYVGASRGEVPAVYVVDRYGPKSIVFQTSDIFKLNGKSTVPDELIQNPNLFTGKYAKEKFALIKVFPRTHCWVDPYRIELKNINLDDPEFSFNMTKEEEDFMRDVALNDMYEAENNLNGAAINKNMTQYREDLATKVAAEKKIIKRTADTLDYKRFEFGEELEKGIDSNKVIVTDEEKEWAKQFNTHFEMEKAKRDEFVAKYGAETYAKSTATNIKHEVGITKSKGEEGVEELKEESGDQIDFNKMDYSKNKRYKDQQEKIESNMKAFTDLADSKDFAEKFLEDEQKRKAAYDKKGIVSFGMAHDDFKKEIDAFAKNTQESQEKQKEKANERIKKVRIENIKQTIAENKEYDGIGKDANAILLKRYVDKVNLGKNIKPLINQYENYDFNLRKPEERDLSYKLHEGRIYLWYKYQDRDFHPQFTFDTFTLPRKFQARSNSYL